MSLCRQYLIRPAPVASPASVMKMAAALPNNNAANVIRDKKTGGNYSAAGDDDINDVAAMGGVNLAEEANVSHALLIKQRY